MFGVLTIVILNFRGGGGGRPQGRPPPPPPPQMYLWHRIAIYTVNVRREVEVNSSLSEGSSSTHHDYLNHTILYYYYYYCNDNLYSLIPKATRDHFNAREK